MKRVCALLLMAVTLAACNTVAGFGQDMRATGNAISNAAK
jgi:predicted small secreted protein